MNELSVVTGGTLTFSLDAGPAHASEYYLVVGSLSGTTPGFWLGDFFLPLNPDSYFTRSVQHPNAPPFTASKGVLDLTGKAQASFTLPPSASEALIGLTAHHAFATSDTQTGYLTFVSNAVPLDFVGSSGLGGMVLIPGGTFVMGDHYGVGWPFELPLHTVTVDSFYMDVYEVTNEQYRDYLNSAYGQGLIDISNGIVHKAGDSEPYCDTDSASSYSRIVWNGQSFEVESGKLDHPMLEVSWYGAVAFANWRSAQDGLSPCYDLDTWSCNFMANGYRLATEAEWEFAARGGEDSPYYKYPWGNSISGGDANYWGSLDPFEFAPVPRTTRVGYYDGNQIPAGGDMANGFGLYDIVGNVWEWCHDWYSSTYYSVSPVSNPQGPSSALYRVARGGGFYSGVIHLRPAGRNYGPPEYRDVYVGFRLAKATTP